MSKQTNNYLNNEFMLSVTIPQDDFNFILKNRDKILIDYALQEAEISDYVRIHPFNSERDVVVKKIHLLNSFYSTRVPVDEMADKILSIENFDSMLDAGNLDLVREIASLSKDYLSFATKYCAMHQPRKFPIYDSLVWSFFDYLFQNNCFKTVTKADMAHLRPMHNNRSTYYSKYVELYNEFMKISTINTYCSNYREVDYCIWGIIIIYEKTHPKDAGNLVSTLQKILGSPIVQGLTANALWYIISKYL